MTETVRAAVIGDPVKHSRSPLIHGYWLKQHAINGRYDPIHVVAGEAPAFFKGLVESGLAGCNVTVPHKEDAFRAMDVLTPTAKAIGAVNTVWMDNGRLHGDNTDAYGFLANLDERVPGWARGGKAAVIGAGGAGRAITRALELAADAGNQAAVRVFLDRKERYGRGEPYRRTPENSTTEN